ncbi:hypothetical protein DFH08DRAFT_158785 [Mycena albidolilacea]|uniref:Zn(2)-C6 fungal-type domain-containing protein n=1 Tax=Mycena albidolilacea TaxID=1033008 RepID=A0AAD7ESL9_9AGAR|nr:hypothetical protein DFH08DRAFT_158785 [Mycena albidolilacea]
MSTPQSLSQSTPFATKRRRTLMACLSCRKRKVRCMTTEQPPKNPCARCTKKKIPCEYIPADQDDHSSSYSSSPQTPEFPETEPPTSRFAIQMAASSSTRSSPRNTPSPYHDARANRRRGCASPLPYTAPPPSSRRPRYSGNYYPDLSLSYECTSMPLQSMKYPYYDPTADPYAAGNPYLYNVYGPQYPGAGYMVPPHTSHTPEPRQPVYAPTPYAPIPMPFFADTSMPALGDGKMFDWLESEDPGLHGFQYPRYK